MNDDQKPCKAPGLRDTAMQVNVSCSELCPTKSPIEEQFERLENSIVRLSDHLFGLKDSLKSVMNAMEERKEGANQPPVAPQSPFADRLRRLESRVEEIIFLVQDIEQQLEL